MFWKKLKNFNQTGSDNLFTLARKLGVERRRSERVNCPTGYPLSQLPAIAFDGQDFPVKNISVGGCCLVDHEAQLKLEVGSCIDLVIKWPALQNESVRSKVVAQVEPNYHIQFLDLRSSRQRLIGELMIPGSRGLVVRPHYPSSEGGPDLVASELWSSPNGDSIVLEDGTHRLAVITFMGEAFTCFRNAWPRTQNDAPCKRVKCEELILFLANVPAPTSSLQALLNSLLSLDTGERDEL